MPKYTSTKPLQQGQYNLNCRHKISKTEYQKKSKRKKKGKIPFFNGRSLKPLLYDAPKKQFDEVLSPLGQLHINEL
jgi:hypothetical protein